MQAANLRAHPGFSGGSISNMAQGFALHTKALYLASSDEIEVGPSEVNRTFCMSLTLPLLGHAFMLHHSLCNLHAKCTWEHQLAIMPMMSQ